jgi:hypothetical protein
MSNLCFDSDVLRHSNPKAENSLRPDFAGDSGFVCFGIRSATPKVSNGAAIVPAPSVIEVS